MKHSKHMPDKMIIIFFCLVCGALAAAQESNQILHPAANRFGNHRANQQVQRPPGTQHTKWSFFISLEVKYVFLYITNKYNHNLLISSKMRSNQSSEQDIYAYCIISNSDESYEFHCVVRIVQYRCYGLWCRTQFLSLVVRKLTVSHYCSLWLNTKLLSLVLYW